MIVETAVRTCNKCQSPHLIKNGTNACGTQQYHCNDCGAYSVVDPHRGYTDEDKERIFGVSRQRLAAWVKKSPARARPEPKAGGSPSGDVLDLDQAWSFVRMKTNKRWLRRGDVPPHAPDRRAISRCLRDR